MTLEIVRLVSVIQDSVAKLATYFESNGIPPPSFNVDVPADLGIPSNLKDMDDARISALSACMELHDLLLGPRKLITTIVSMAGLTEEEYTADLKNTLMSFASLDQPSRTAGNLSVRRSVQVSNWRRNFI